MQTPGPHPLSMESLALVTTIFSEVRADRRVQNAHSFQLFTTRKGHFWP